jgi:hypothetical protein
MERHRHVREEVAARVRLVGADPADLGCEVQHDVGPRIAVQPLDGRFVQQVVVASARHDDVGHAKACQPRENRAPEKARTACDDDTGTDEGGSVGWMGHSE